MNTRHSWKAIVIAFGISCMTSRAEDWWANNYVHADIGPSFIPNTFVHQSTRTTSSGVIRNTFLVRSQTGIRGDIALGHNFARDWAIELESGIIWNAADAAAERFYQFPILLNTIYQIPLKNSFHPYFGLGAGAVLNNWQTIVDPINSPFPPIHTHFRYNATDVEFGYQVEAGIKYSVTHRAEINLGYKLLGETQNNWNSSRISFRTGELFTHAALLSFTWKF